MPATNPHSKSATQYNVTVNDQAGVGGEKANLIAALVHEAGKRISAFVPGTGTVDVSVVIDSSTAVAHGISTPGPQVGTFNGKPLIESAYLHEIKTGVDINGSAADVTIHVSGSYNFYLDPDPSDNVTFYGHDFLTVAIHELLHSLAISGYLDPRTGQSWTDFYRPVDMYVTMSGGNPYYTGPNSQAVFGGPVPLTPGNLYHYGTAPANQSPTYLAGLMNGVQSVSGRIELNDLDLAWLKDAQVPVSLSGDALAQVYGTNGADAIRASAPSHIRAFGGNDTIMGSAGNDIIDAGSGSNTIDGGGGVDVLTLAGARSAYAVNRTQAGVTVSSSTTSVNATSLEKLSFSDVSINLGLKQEATRIAPAQLKLLSELYVAFFNRVPEADGMSYWIGQVAAGQSFDSIADAFYAAALQYPQLTGYASGMSSTDFVKLIYRNVLGRTDGGDAEGIAFWSNALDTGSQTRGALVTTILASAHTFKGHATYGYVADLLDNKATVATHFAINQGISYNDPQESIREGMEIAAAVTPNDVSAAIRLIGLPELA